MSDEKQPEKEGVWARFGPLLTSWAIFLGVLGTMVGIYEWKPNLVNRDFARWTADIMGRIMELLGEDMTVKGVFIRFSRCRFVSIGRSAAPWLSRNLPSLSKTSFHRFVNCASISTRSTS